MKSTLHSKGSAKLQAFSNKLAKQRQILEAGISETVAEIDAIAKQQQALEEEKNRCIGLVNEAQTMLEFFNGHIKN